MLLEAGFNFRCFEDADIWFSLQNSLDPFCSFFQIFASFSWASSSLKVMFGLKACECHCLSSLSVYNIHYFSLFVFFSLPSLKEKELSFWFCCKVLWSFCLCWYRSLSLARSSPVVSRGITSEGEQRDSVETLEILSTL